MGGTLRRALLIGATQVVLVVGVLAGPGGADEPPATPTDSTSSTTTATTSDPDDVAERAPSVTAYVATGQDHPDAAVAASRGGAFVVLTLKETLPPTSRDELVRQQPDRIIIVGGEQAIARSVEEEIRRLKIGEVERLAGADRYQTAAMLAADLAPPVGHLDDKVILLLLLATLAYALLLPQLVQMLLIRPNSAAAVRNAAAGVSARAKALLGNPELTLTAGAYASQALDLVAGIAEDIPDYTYRLTQSDVLAAWERVHQAEQLLVLAEPWSAVEANYVHLFNTLKLVKTAEGHAELMRQLWDRRAGVKRRRLRATYLVGLRLYHAERDSHFRSLAGWDVKARLLIGVSAALVLFAAAAHHRESLLLLGAIGGLLSRLVYVARRQPATADYGASWSRLLLAPVAGALAGWAGTLLMELLRRADVLDDALSVGWDDPTKAEALAIAFLFGFSERALPQVVDFAEARLSKSTTPPDTGSETAATLTGSEAPADPLTPTAANPTAAAGTAILPDVAGLPLDKATNWLEALGFTPKADVEVSAVLTVKATLPPPGRVAKRGSEVVLALSPVKVPRVAGKTQGAARRAINATGLVPVPSKPSGRLSRKVTRTDPIAGKELPPGTEVTLHLAAED